MFGCPCRRGGISTPTPCPHWLPQRFWQHTCQYLPSEMI